MKMSLLLILISVLSFSYSPNASAHCQIPCGIYDDEARIAELHEHIRTIEKSIKSIEDMNTSGETNHHQFVRWVNNKEEHAQKIQDMVQAYFLAQRIKLVDPEDQEAYAIYLDQVTALHELIVYAMKAKQQPDLAHVQALHETLVRFEKSYLAGK